MWVLILVAAAAITAAFLIRRDSGKRGKNSLFWFVFTLLLFGICAIPIYYYSIRRDAKSSSR
jgi:archaellum biogenesis protein FlaJ (TadC family)